jgi:hypothetical protein
MRFEVSIDIQRLSTPSKYQVKRQSLTGARIEVVSSELDILNDLILLHEGGTMLPFASHGDKQKVTWFDTG